jgi:hypothetical protein
VHTRLSLIHLMPIVIVAALLAGCGGADVPVASGEAAPAQDTPVAVPIAHVAATATRIRPTPRPTVRPTPTQTGGLVTLVDSKETPAPLRLVADPGIPASAISATLGALAVAGVDALKTGDHPDLLLDRASTPGSRLVFERVLVPAARFATLLDSISLEDLRAAWSGKGTPTTIGTIYPSQEIVPDLEALLGPPGETVKPQPAATLADSAWADPKGIVIVPFEALTPRLRALRIDGESATDNRFDQAKWPLVARTWLVGTTPAGRETLDTAVKLQSATNRDPARLTVVAMTGVTAITRLTAVAIEKQKDFAFPARVVGPELAAADLTTTSNEIPFLDGCVPDPNTMVFCSKPEYYATLELSGIDLVGLTGNHVNDRGIEAFLSTLKFYEDKKIRTYGGGKDDESARAPLIVEHNGNRLAFMGANQWGPPGAWATDQNPGSARYDQKQMVDEVKAVRPKVDVVFAELQYIEVNGAGDYQIEPVSGQKEDFDAIFDAGADVVTGMQAHAPQAMELRGNGLILFGLGNLYFDQTWSWPTRTGVIARHTVYAGRLLNTELLVTVIDDDMQLRWATPKERADVLASLFAGSGW